MFEKYFAQYKEPTKINPSFNQPMNDDEKRISKYLVFNKEQLLTDIAERINAENMNVPTEHLPNMRIMHAGVVQKGIIRFHIHLDPTLSSVIRPLYHILGNFFCVKKEEELRYELSPYIAQMGIQSLPTPPFNMSQPFLSRTSVGMFGNDQLWTFDVTKLSMVE